MENHHMDDDSVQANQPVMCANGCGFYGNPINQNLCSKCNLNVEAREKAAKALKETASPSPVKQAVEAVVEAASAAALPPPAPSVSESKEDARHGGLVASGEGSGAGEEAMPVQKNPNRCFTCNKKVGLTGFKCRCSYVYCATHRYSDKHECTFDYKQFGRESIAKANPTIVATKVEKI